MKSRTQLKLVQGILTATNKPHQQKDAGFTVVELVIGMLMIAILTSIAAPGWLAFINNQRLRTAQSRVYGALQLAQSNAKRDKLSWQASFRTQGNSVQWAIHPATSNLNLNSFKTSTSRNFSENTWINLEDESPKIQIDTSKTNLVTVDPITNTVQTSVGSSVYTAIFNRQGCFVDNGTKECTDAATVVNFNNKGMITLKHTQLGPARKCASVETLLGTIRTGEDASNCTP